MKIYGMGWEAVLRSPDDEGAGGGEGTGGEGTGDTDQGGTDDTALGGGGDGEEDSGSALGGKAKESEGEGAKDKEGGEGNSDTDSDADGESGGAPEAYADFTVPEGVTLDEKLLTGFKEWAKANDVSQAAAQEMVDNQVAHDQRVAKDGEEAQEAKTVKQNKEWVQAQKDHPEYGGADHADNVQHARVAVNELGGQELRDAISEAGVGEQPVLWAAFVKLGKLMADDTIDLGDANKELSKHERVTRLFPNSNLQQN